MEKERDLQYDTDKYSQLPWPLSTMSIWFKFFVNQQNPRSHMSISRYSTLLTQKRTPY